MIDMLVAANKHFVAVLKDNQPGLLAEARLLLPGEAPGRFVVPKAPGKSPRQVELRQADGFTTESIHTRLRVVHAHETGTRHELVAGTRVGTRVDTPIDTHWWWATTMPAAFAPGRVVFEFGHNRWRIENEGFNGLSGHWHSGHVRHHHANSLLVLWLVLFTAHATFHFFLRNIQPVLRAAHSVIHFAALVSADLYQDRWWPPRPP
jgi:hypothetical protein